MNFTSTELISWVTLYSWPFVRIAAFVSVAPIFGTHTVPMRVRLMIAIALAMIAAPVLPKMKFIDPLSYEGIVVTFHQVLIGLAIGFTMTLIFSVHHRQQK